MMTRAQRIWIGGAAILASVVVFLVPFAFIVLMAFKDKRESSLREFSLPSNGFHLWDNLVEVIQTRDFMLLTAFLTRPSSRSQASPCWWSSAPWSATWCSGAHPPGLRSSTSWCWPG